MPDESGDRWVLSFDASCATCREISATVTRACAGRLEALPLSHHQVREWREEALGPRPPWAPTLLRVTGDQVRAWHGTAMLVPLSRRLGARTGVRVLRALGRLRQEARRVPTAVSREAVDGLGRGRFLQLAVGAGVAAGVVLLGRTPAIAEQRCATAAAWAARNKDHLPQRYDDIITYPMAYRRAVYAQLPTNARAQCWTEHLERNRPRDVTGDQRAVLDSAKAMLSTPAVLAIPRTPAVSARLEAFHRKALAAFGPAKAGALFATLGPADRTEGTVSPDETCTCTTESNWCDNWNPCSFKYDNCTVTNGGCGSYWLYDCDGICVGVEK
ncbi:bacteriocin fulvocin C-related protein [Streptomyces sp. PTM05]|uniref:Bacteriocin fulvocin C-related protein n=1 Tax=Streptantibioticus parmotrematis TaxID=2873249 RepID=A0ABS7QQ75_9ACTN|nr:bacteriocin fulvocin C-related protein [Streptantibioticus parmotrematis]MBY8885327.1 bacteriocin fulvocin C-related protein [Streptantibioticus parmotrematis]